MALIGKTALLNLPWLQINGSLSHLNHYILLSARLVMPVDFINFYFTFTRFCRSLAGVLFKSSSVIRLRSQINPQVRTLVELNASFFIYSLSIQFSAFTFCR